MLSANEQLWASPEFAGCLGQYLAYGLGIIGSWAQTLAMGFPGLRSTQLAPGSPSPGVLVVAEPIAQGSGVSVVKIAILIDISSQQPFLQTVYLAGAGRSEVMVEAGSGFAASGLQSVIAAAERALAQSTR